MQNGYTLSQDKMKTISSHLEKANANIDAAACAASAVSRMAENNNIGVPWAIIDPVSLLEKLINVREINRD